MRYGVLPGPFEDKIYGGKSGGLVLLLDSVRHQFRKLLRQNDDINRLLSEGTISEEEFLFLHEELTYRQAVLLEQEAGLMKEVERIDFDWKVEGF